MEHHKLKLLEEPFSVCKVESVSDVNFAEDFVFVGKTDTELSLVCQTRPVPPFCTVREDGWSAFRVEGQLDFSLIGILSDIARVLAERKISIFVVSTYQTDYVLVKSVQWNSAVAALGQNGYQFL